MSEDKKRYWQEKLAGSMADLENLLSSLNEEQLHTPIISEGNTWDVLDLVAHLVENERGMSIHIHKIRQGKETVPADFDLNKWNAGLKERVGRSTLSELRQNLIRTRAGTLAELESLKDEDWSLPGRHPARGLITVEQYYETMVGHIAGHIGDIKKALALQ